MSVLVHLIGIAAVHPQPQRVGEHSAGLPDGVPGGQGAREEQPATGVHVVRERLLHGRTQVVADGNGQR